MRFDVPQFIDVEDKIFGPLTFRQFAYLVGGGGLIYVLIEVLPLFIAIIVAIPIGGFAFALAFVKINNRPFIDTVESALNYFLRDKLYIWKKEKKKRELEKEKVKEIKRQNLPMVTGSKLHDVAWGLDVLNSRNQER